METLNILLVLNGCRNFMFICFVNHVHMIIRVVEQRN